MTMNFSLALWMNSVSPQLQITKLMRRIKRNPIAPVYLLILFVLVIDILYTFLRHSPSRPVSNSHLARLGWIENGISESSQGRVWIPRKWRTYSDQCPPRSRHKLSTKVIQNSISPYKCTNWAVITTIFPPTKLARQLKQLQDWCTVIVADEKTKWTEWSSFINDAANMVYLSPEMQQAQGFSIMKHIKQNHFGVKNIGYLFAIQHGAHAIWDTDDDNELKSDTLLIDMVSAAYSPDSIALARGDHHLWNPYPSFKPIRLASAQSEDICWPRGFPLEYIRDEATQLSANSLQSIPSSSVGVYQSLADHDPDVDAMYRLTKDIPFSFSGTKQKTALGLHRYSPFNAQATLWMPSSFWAMLMPISLHGRVTDIWRSFIAERLMGDVGLHVVFTSAIVTQFRNKHSLIADLQSEIPLYTQSNELTKWLLAWKGHGSLEERVDQLVIGLFEIGILEESDVLLYKAWMNDLQEIGYNFPAIQIDTDTPRIPARKELATRVPNVAVCVSGQLRTLTMHPSSPDYPDNWGRLMHSKMSRPNISVAESIQKNLFPKLGNPDVFMHVTTRETSREPRAHDVSVCEPLRPSRGHLSCSVPLERNISGFELPIWDDFALIQVGIRHGGIQKDWRKEANGRGPMLVQGLLQQLSGMFECHRAIEHYSIESGKQYDWIVRVRPDVYIHTFPTLEQLTQDSLHDPTVWYARNDTCCCGNEDWFGVAPAKLMRFYFNRYLHLQQKDWNAFNNTWNAEYFLQQHMKDYGAHIRPHEGIQGCTVKPKYRRGRSQP